MKVDAWIDVTMLRKDRAAMFMFAMVDSRSGHGWKQTAPSAPARDVIRVVSIVWCLVIPWDAGCSKARVVVPARSR